MKNITTLNYKGRTFEIVKRDGWYLAIEDKYIDADGNLTVELNGAQMKASKQLQRTLDYVKAEIEIEEIMKQTGLDRMHASIEWARG